MATIAETPLSSGYKRAAAVPSAKRLHVRAFVFLGLALVFASAAAWLVTRTLGKQKPEVMPAPMRQIVVAAVDVPAATTLEASMLKLADWPAQSLPPRALGDTTAVVGRVTASSVVEGEPLVESRLAPAGAGQGMAAVIPKTMRAMTVAVDEVIGVSGFIHAGDHVDVVATMMTPLYRGSTEREYRSRIVLQDVPVIAVGDDMVTRGTKTVKVPVVTLLVTPDQSEHLALAHTYGKLQLTLRTQSDRDAVATAGVVPDELLAVPDAPRRVEVTTSAGKEHVRVRTIARQGAKQPPATPAPVEKKAAEPDVIEVMHGDRLEERKVHARNGHTHSSGSSVDDSTKEVLP